MGASLAGERKIVWCVLFAASLGVVLALAPLPAAAQILDPPSRDAEPRRPQLRPTLPAGTTPLEEPSLAEEDRRAFEDGRFGPRETSPSTADEAAPAEDGDQDQAGEQIRAEDTSEDASGAGDAAAAEDDPSAKRAPGRAASSRRKTATQSRSSSRRRRKTASSISTSRRLPSRVRRTSPRRTCARPRMSGHLSTSPRRTIHCCCKPMRPTRFLVTALPRLRARPLPADRHQVRQLLALHDPRIRRRLQ